MNNRTATKQKKVVRRKISTIPSETSSLNGEESVVSSLMTNESVEEIDDNDDYDLEQLLGKSTSSHAPTTLLSLPSY
jgi:hypothetical protein